MPFLPSTRLVATKTRTPGGRVSIHDAVARAPPTGERLGRHRDPRRRGRVRSPKTISIRRSVGATAESTSTPTNLGGPDSASCVLQYPRRITERPLTAVNLTRLNLDCEAPRARSAPAPLSTASIGGVRPTFSTRPPPSRDLRPSPVAERRTARKHLRDRGHRWVTEHHSAALLAHFPGRVVSLVREPRGCGTWPLLRMDRQHVYPERAVVHGAGLRPH